MFKVRYKAKLQSVITAEYIDDKGSVNTMNHIITTDLEEAKRFIACEEDKLIQNS